MLKKLRTYAWTHPHALQRVKFACQLIVMGPLYLALSFSLVTIVYLLGWVKSLLILLYLSAIVILCVL